MKHRPGDPIVEASLTAQVDSHHSLVEWLQLHANDPVMPVVNITLKNVHLTMTEVMAPGVSESLRIVLEMVSWEAVAIEGIPS